MDDAAFDVYVVVSKLIGHVTPVGDTFVDDQRFANLKVLTSLAEKLIIDITIVSLGHNRPEASVRRAGKYAKDALAGLAAQTET